MSYQMNPIDNNPDGAVLIRFIYRNRKSYLLIAIVAILGGIGISMMIKPKYYSNAILFPVQNNSIESVVDFQAFGYDVEADRMLQVLYSEEVFDSCTVKFSLYSLLNVDSTKLTARDELKDKFYRQVSFTRSQYVSIVIAATTTKPELSAELVNYIITLSDGIRNRIYKKNLSIVYRSLENEYTERRNHLDILTDSVTALRGATSIEVLTMMNNQVVLKNNNSSTAKEQTNLERILNNYLFEQSRINDLYERYMKAKTQFERPITQVFVLQYAKPSYQKRSPDYFLNVLITMVCSMVFLTGFILLRDKIKSAKLSD